MQRVRPWESGCDRDDLNGGVVVVVRSSDAFREKISLVREEVVFVSSINIFFISSSHLFLPLFILLLVVNCC
ncbi:hypothetical protein QVD17_07215 [Tagetes erecta]|uniref:Transmembrane protein n=1 Tax=Tagetes erecta TaxID=13708 RepID=A0AAD8LF19_TARER|nr:hypothetical protein QVD17_07215 [Tagetes erecta]